MLVRSIKCIGRERKSCLVHCFIIYSGSILPRNLQKNHGPLNDRNETIRNRGTRLPRHRRCCLEESREPYVLPRFSCRPYPNYIRIRCDATMYYTFPLLPLWSLIIFLSSLIVVSLFWPRRDEHTGFLQPKRKNKLIIEKGWRNL